MTHKPPPCVPACPCGAPDDFRIYWQSTRDGRRQLRADCARCGRFLSYLPHRPPFIALADAAASETPILDVLVRLDSIGVALHSDGAEVWVPPPYNVRVGPDLAALIRQCSHELAQLIGRDMGRRHRQTTIPTVKKTDPC